MPVSNPNSQTILPATQSSGGSLKEKANKLRYDSASSKDAPLWSTTAEAFSNAQSQIDHLSGALRSPLPTPQIYQVTDPSGNLIAEIGNLTGTNNQAFQGLWGTNLYVGGTGPDTAPVFVDTRGSGAQVFVVDQFGNVGAWLGNQTELPKTITNVISCATAPYTGLVQITVTSHGYVSGDNVHIVNVVGVPNANISMGIIQVLDANNFVLLATPFSGAYISGGQCTRFFSGGMFAAFAVGGSQIITNIQNNAGLIQITVPNHGYQNGYAVIITDTAGIPGLNYVSWNVTIIDANNFTLNGSVFAGAYDGLGGQCLNWPTSKLIAYDNGNLIINGAVIIVDGDGITTQISNAPLSTGPWTGQAASMTSTDNATGAFSEIDPFHLAVFNAAGNPVAWMDNSSGSGQWNIKDSSGIVGKIATFDGATMRLTMDAGATVHHKSILTTTDLTFSTATGGVTADYGEFSAVLTDGTNTVTIAQADITVTDGTHTVTLIPTNVDSPGFSTGGVPGISSVLSYGSSLTVNTANAVTNVTGVAGLVLTRAPFVTSVTLNLASNTWTEGLLTA